MRVKCRPVSDATKGKLEFKPRRVADRVCTSCDNGCHQLRFRKMLGSKTGVVVGTSGRARSATAPAPRSSWRWSEDNQSVERDSALEWLLRQQVRVPEREPGTQRSAAAAGFRAPGRQDRSGQRPGPRCVGTSIEAAWTSGPASPGPPLVTERRMVNTHPLPGTSRTLRLPRGLDVGARDCQSGSHATLVAWCLVKGLKMTAAASGGCPPQWSSTSMNTSLVSSA